jgi:hypothetical protein
MAERQAPGDSPPAPPVATATAIIAPTSTQRGSEVVPVSMPETRGCKRSFSILAMEGAELSFAPLGPMRTYASDCKVDTEDDRSRSPAVAPPAPRELVAPPACSVCYEFLVEPHVTQCGHTVCRACAPLVTTSGKCPLCRAPITASLSRNHQLWEMISALYPEQAKAAKRSVDSAAMHSMLNRMVSDKSIGFKTMYMKPIWAPETQACVLSCLQSAYESFVPVAGDSSERTYMRMASHFRTKLYDLFAESDYLTVVLTGTSGQYGVAVTASLGRVWGFLFRGVGVKLFCAPREVLRERARRRDTVPLSIAPATQPPPPPAAAAAAAAAPRVETVPSGAVASRSSAESSL